MQMYLVQLSFKKYTGSKGITNYVICVYIAY